MLETGWDFILDIMGIGDQNLSSSEMAVRAIATFIVTLALVRIGDKRMFGKGTAFDTVVAIMIGSVMSRAITGQAPLLQTWVAGAVLVGLHWLIAFLTIRLSWFGPLAKGTPVLLVEEGEIQQSAMRTSSITHHDLQQALRIQGIEPDPSQVERAYLERDGSISVITRKQESRVLDVSVADGVQTVRIAVE